ncbi:hypothetical protein LF887_14450 [Chryseobacterium sp. MEBOG06]|uniref:hypothetical protein n=1 Tax=Chryseobacterium sp. MEBOG06 TaxID=2879938 RepID=UPI001F400670|nr:hypothetical protein [Chryseobacterium sp. MEBOG06]UKB82206.1 hypothetical protein LF887_14450 [Chryseobacterium sp. MEBOG06]
MTIKSALFSLAALTMLSCNQKKNGYEIDCEYEKKQAQNDFNYKKYTWTIFSGQGGYILGREEFIILLNQNHIETIDIPLSCMRYANDRYENCREIEMNRLIRQKFGKGFIDSLKYLANKRFIENHPDEVFSYQECDDISRYPNSTADNQFKKISQDYFIKYPSPSKYIKKNKDEHSSYTSASFVLTKNGKIKELTIDSEFQNKKNNIFEKQFNTQLENFVLQTEWIPGKINGLNVDSYYDVSIHYD